MVCKKKSRLILLAFTGLIFIFACTEEKKERVFVQKYTGPLIIADSVNTLYSDSAKTKMRLQAVEQQEFASGDRLFPKGVIIYFYNSLGKVESKLSAQKGKFVKTTNIFTASGNVVVENPIEKKRLNTELLNWNSQTKKVFTDKFVKIQTKQDVLYGTGLEADETFTTYKILNPSGFGTANSF